MLQIKLMKVYNIFDWKREFGFFFFFKFFVECQQCWRIDVISELHGETI